MLQFSSPLFWYKLVFLTELIVAEGLATYTLKKRERFFLRLVLSLLAVYGIAFLLPILPNNVAYTSLLFFAMFALTLGAMKACYAEPILNLVFCGIIAYTTQHIAYEIYGLTVSVLGLGSSAYVYGGAVTDDSYNVFTGIPYACAYFIVYWACWAFVERRIRQQEDLSLNQLSLFFFAALIVAVDIVLSMVVTYLPSNDDTKPFAVLISVYNILSCVLALGMQFSMLGKKLAEKELETVRELWNRDKKMYEMSKENVELINVKCHDLKKQIRALRTATGEVDKNALADIESAVNIYDGSVKTGCEVLDVILAEKSLICERRAIKLTCIVDGDKLNFLPVTEIYSLFENAIQNAIEAVSEIDDKERRIIRLKVCAVEGMLSIHAENFVAVEPAFVDGLPQTTKDDKRFHGFGVRSMRMIAEKYGGGLTAAIEDGMFNLDIVFPMENQLGNGKV